METLRGLLADNAILIEIEFNKKKALLWVGKSKYKIHTEGFWYPRIVIEQRDTEVAVQKIVGLWGTKSELVIEDQIYTVSTKQDGLFNLTYSLNSTDILTYQLDAFGKKPRILFAVKSTALGERELLLLMALGFYSIKNVAIEALANDFIVSAVS